MLDSNNSDTLAALANFTHLTTSYKTVDGHPIAVHVLLPKNASSATPLPLFVRFHGGAFITGSAMFLDWFAPWIVRWGISHSGVMVLPDYRLLPEANGSDILEDVSDFWQWVRNDLQDYIDQHSDSHVEIDLSRTIALGESVGGYLAVQSGFLAPVIEPAIRICGIVAQSPMLDLEDPWYTVPGHKEVLKPLHLPLISDSMIADHLREMRANGPIVPVTERAPEDYFPLVVACIQHGYTTTFLQGDEKTLNLDCFPLRRLNKIHSYPPLFILHGLQDSAVPVEGTTRFVRALKERIPNTKVWMELHDGDHGFDKHLDEKKNWLGEALRWIEGFGLVQKV